MAVIPCGLFRWRDAQKAGPCRDHELWWPTCTAFERAVDAAPDALEALLAKAGKSWTTLVQAERFI